MATTAKPKRSTTAAQLQSDPLAEFLAGGGSTKAEPAPAPDDGNKKPVMIRFDTALLKRVDVAAKKRGVSRSAWVQFMLSTALDAGEG